MGLSASQARLLSLSNRQHAVEGKAQALQQRKMLLANDQDKAYKSYLNVLNDTMIKTLQTNSDTGSKTWIDGSINNLMRNGTAYNTSGNIFYIQDLTTGQIYVPKNINYTVSTDTREANVVDENGVYTPASLLYDENSIVSGTMGIDWAIAKVKGDTLDEQARSFAEQFGVTYKKVDVNEQVVTDYENAMAKGWNTVLGYQTDYENDKILELYYDAVEKDRNQRVMASTILSFIPPENGYGVYDTATNYGNDSMMQSYVNYAKKVVETYNYNKDNPEVDNPYSEDEINLIKKSLSLLLYDYNIDFPKDEKGNSQTTLSYAYSNLINTTTSLGSADLFNGFKDAFQVYDEDNPSPYLSVQLRYALENITIKSDNYTYLKKDYKPMYKNDNDETEEPSAFSDYEKYLLMLNGGTLTWKGECESTVIKSNFATTTETTEFTKEFDVYKDIGKSEGFENVLTCNGKTYKNFGEALTDIFTRVSIMDSYENKFLDATEVDPKTKTSSNARPPIDDTSGATATTKINKPVLTREDIQHYLKYKDYKEKWLDYLNSPIVYEYIPSDKGKATQYEQLYKALVSCGKSNVKSEDLTGLSDKEKIKKYAESGYIDCDDDRSKNSSWVSNMIRSGKVIITTWDPEMEILSKTSPSLNTKIIEVSDKTRLEKASQDYEAELDLIKQKDNTYDIVLNQLESEQNAIQTEIDALEDVIKLNIDKHFKVFG